MDYDKLFTETLRTIVREEVQRQMRSQQEPQPLVAHEERQERVPAKESYTVAEITEILETSSLQQDGRLKRIAQRLGKSEAVIYNIRSNYRKWKQTGKASSPAMDKLFAEYEKNKGWIPIDKVTFIGKAKDDLPEMSDPEAGGVTGYYMDDIKTYLGSDEKFAEFEEWFRGRTGGMYNGNIYVLRSDFQKFLGNSVPDTKQPSKLNPWTLEEVEVALDAQNNEIHEVADLLNRTFDAVKSLRWRYRTYKAGKEHGALTQGIVSQFKQYDNLKGKEDNGENSNR